MRPSEDEHTLQNLLDAPVSSIRPEFNAGVQNVRELIGQNVPVKTFNDKKINGADLVMLADSYTQGINEKGVPVIQTAWN